jgi:hypothetical protein
MGLAILGIMVVVGVAAIVAAVHYTAPGEAAGLPDDAVLRDILLEDYPDVAPGQVIRSVDGHTAFVELGEGGMGIVRRMGGRHITRVLPAGSAAVRMEGDELVLRFGDLGWDGGRFAFESPDAAAAVARLIGRGRQA